MEALTARDPVPKVSLPKLLCRPLVWAALAAFLGSAVGLAGALSWPSWWSPFGGLLVMPALLGVAPLVGRGSWAARIGSVLLLLWLSASVYFVLYFSLLRWEPGASATPPLPVLVSLYVSWWGGSAAVLPFALGAIFAARKWRLAALLLALSLPGSLLFLYASPMGTGMSLKEIASLIGPLSLPGAGVGIPEAILWTLLGILLLGEARQRAAGKLREDIVRENKNEALCLYEEGLGKADHPAVDAVVSEDFHDLGSGARGRPAMDRIIENLWATYPDLSVSVKAQEAQGDLVRTHLEISGTDRGQGVMWYPPTGRRVSFEAVFSDRFRDGELVEHAGEADTEGLLRQLGHQREG